MSLLIKNGRVVDPANGVDEVLDVLIEGATIAKVARGIKPNGAQVLSAEGKIVMPGLVDMHVHLREPGREDKETVASGTAAALKGGVTSLLAMPNTAPAMDSVENISRLKEIIAKTAKANVWIAGALTRGRRGEELTDGASLLESGACALTDDGSSVDNDDLMRRAMTQAAQAGIPVICHSEDKALSAQGVMNLGLTSTILGLRGIPNAAEYHRVERDIRLGAETGCAVHIAHVSCRESVEIIRRAKAKGTLVTCETAPHYVALTEEALADYDTNFKINPPLRSKDDRQALLEGLKDGTIDVLASDHAPHTEYEKEIEFDRAEFGVTGLETMLAVCVTELILAQVLSWPQAAAKLAWNPAKILKSDRGTLGAGRAADIVIVDPQGAQTVTREGFVSKSGNSAFLGRTLKGVVAATILAGQIAYEVRR